MFGRKPKAGEEQEKLGFFGRLRARLNRGDSFLTRDLGELFRGRQIDAAALEELETRLLTADAGRRGDGVHPGRPQEPRRAQGAGGRQRAHRRAPQLGRRDSGALRASRSSSTSRRSRFVILVVGVNGSGKTTTIGKLARRLGQDDRSVMLAAGDTFRAAAMEQLNVWADRSGATFAAQQAGADPGAVVFDALQSARSQKMDVLLADTAGRLHAQTHLMEELKKVKRVIQRVDPSAPHEVLLVLDANQGQNALSQAIQFHEAVGVTGLVLTKLDGTAKGGIVLAIARKLGLPIRFIGVGEQPEDFGEFDAQAFAAALVQGAGYEAGAGEAKAATR